MSNLDLCRSIILLGSSRAIFTSTVMSTPGNQIIVTKASGEKVPFSIQKLQQSLRRVGADDSLISDVVGELTPQLYENIPTKKIYKLAFKILRKVSKPHAARYKLKEAILQLGPSGYAFEKFIGEILKSQGFNVEVGVVVDGYCVKHEVDVVAQKGDLHYIIECKFHNEPGIKCDVKIPLYIQARFQDIQKKWSSLPGHATKSHQGWVVTNTKFSSDAIQYGACAGLHLLGWDYPSHGSLNELIDASGLHPITCLSSLTRSEKEELLEKKIVLSKELYDNSQLLNTIGVSSERRGTILKEVSDLRLQFSQAIK